MNCYSVSPSHRLQFFTNCSGMDPSMGCSPSGTDCSRTDWSIVTHRVTIPASKPALARALLSPWVHRCCQESATAWASHWVIASFGCIHLLWCGVIQELQVDICSTMDLHGLQVNSLPHHGLLHGLQENRCSVRCSASPSSSFTDLGACRIFSLT